MRFAIVLGERGRVMCAADAEFAPLGAVAVDSLPAGDIHDYLYVKGAYVHEPIPAVVVPAVPDPLADLTALMVDHEYRLIIKEMEVSTNVI